MQKRPLFFNLIPLMLLGAVLSLPIQVMTLYKLKFYEWDLVLSKLTPLNYLMALALLALAFETFKLKKSVFILLPFSVFIVFINNFIVGHMSDTYNLTQTTLCSLLYLGFVALYYQKDIYHIITKPEGRWWRSDKRKRAKIPLTIISANEKIKTASFDISKSGLFACNDPDFELFQIKKNKKINIIVHIDEKKSIEVEGELVRKSLRKGIYPEGVGIKLIPSAEYFKDWSQYVSQLLTP